MTRFGRTGQPRRSPRARADGLSIVEILVTLVLISLVFGALFGVIQIASKQIYWGGDETLATIYAADIMEVIRGAPYDAFFWKDEELNLTLDDIFKKHPIPAGDDLGKYDPRFTILADVTAAGDMPRSVLKRVRVRVTWKDRSNDVRRDIKLVTFYGPPN